MKSGGALSAYNISDVALRASKSECGQFRYTFPLLVLNICHCSAPMCVERVAGSVYR
jgi:hypothetical protein